MKINWGTGIVLAFIAFICFILYFVFLASSDPKADHDMVTDDYYKKELEYQRELDASENLKKLSEKVEITRDTSGLSVRFPQSMEPEKIEGTVSLYRPSNEQLDFEIPIQISDSVLLIPDSRLLDGRWDMRMEWSYEGTPYLFRTRVTY